MAKEKNERTYSWYAKQLGISVRTAERRGKKNLMTLLAEQEAEDSLKEDGIQEHLSSLLKDKQNIVKNLDSHLFLDLDENKVNEETRKIGIDLLNKTLKSLSGIVDEIVDQNTDMSVYQRSCMLLGSGPLIEIVNYR